MKIVRVDNLFHSDLSPAISAGDDEYWFSLGKLHRGGGAPAVLSGMSRWWYWRGIRITKEISERKLSPTEILKIPNMEQRQAAMEILGYEKFFSMAKLIHKFTPPQWETKFPVDKNPMYSLFLLQTGTSEEGEDIKILMMCDPSKFPFVKYFIRVPPDEIDCGLAVAHSYDYASWAEFSKEKTWV